MRTDIKINKMKKVSENEVICGTNNHEMSCCSGYRMTQMSVSMIFPALTSDLWSLISERTRESRYV